MDRKTRIDDPDDEMIPASPGRRRAALTIGCLMAVALLVALVWFAATLTATMDAPSWFGS